MQDLATVERTGAPTALKASKPPRISAKIKKAIHLLTTGECKTQKAASVRVGVSEAWLSTQLNKPGIQVFVAGEARKTIARGVMRASARVVELMDAGSEHVSLDASKHVLAVEGIKPVETGTNISIINNVAPGYVIDMRDPRDARTIDATTVERE